MTASNETGPSSSSSGVGGVLLKPQPPSKKPSPPQAPKPQLTPLRPPTTTSPGPGVNGGTSQWQVGPPTPCTQGGQGAGYVNGSSNGGSPSTSGGGNASNGAGGIGTAVAEPSTSGQPASGGGNGLNAPPSLNRPAMPAVSRPQLQQPPRAPQQQQQNLRPPPGLQRPPAMQPPQRMGPPAVAPKPPVLNSNPGGGLATPPQLPRLKGAGVNPVLPPPPRPAQPGLAPPLQLQRPSAPQQQGGLAAKAPQLQQPQQLQRPARPGLVQNPSLQRPGQPTGGPQGTTQAEGRTGLAPRPELRRPGEMKVSPRLPGLTLPPQQQGGAGPGVLNVGIRRPTSQQLSSRPGRSQVSATAAQVLLLVTMPVSLGCCAYLHESRACIHFELTF